MKRTLKLFLLFLATLSFAQTTPQTSWWNDAVFYEVFVRSFKDNNGDGKGDLQGLIGKLDYLNDGDTATHNDLGVTAIWLMPIQQSPSYHGYDVTDYRTVEQDYGTNQEFTDFINAAHARGIKVIIDYVMNHSSSQHPWFIESTNPASAKRDWYVWNSTNPGILGPWSQQVWHPRNGAYNYGIFWSEMPDLNYNTQAVKDEMFETARFWLEDMNVDGFRLDAIKYIKENGNTLEDTPETIQFWKDFRAHYKGIDANALSVGEAWTSTDKVAPYVNNDGLDFCFEFDLATAILDAANTGTTTALQAQMEEVVASYPHLQYGTFLTNHDINRAMSQLGGSTTKSKIAADLLLTLPGIPYVYYGEEIGMIGTGADENKRTPLQWNATSQAGFTTGSPWRPVNGDYTSKNIAAQQQTTTSLWNRYRNLIAIRNNQEALRKGSYKNVSTSTAAVFSFLRQYEDQHVLVVSNAGTTVATNVQLSVLTAGIAEGNYTLIELQSGSQFPITIDNTGGFSNYTIASMAARSSLILKFVATTSTTASVTFQVDMNALITNGNFIPASETVDIVASFNNYGVDFISTLSDPEQDGFYSVVIPGQNVGNTVTYKYRINATNDERTEWSTTATLRNYMVLEGFSKIKDVYQLPIISGVKNPVEHNFAVYPVPANNQIFVEYPNDFSGPIHYQITDLTGKEKASSTFRSALGEATLSCEDMPTGVYLLSLEHNGTREVFRIVVQK